MIYCALSVLKCSFASLNRVLMPSTLPGSSLTEATHKTIATVVSRRGFGSQTGAEFIRPESNNLFNDTKGRSSLSLVSTRYRAKIVPSSSLNSKPIGIQHGCRSLKYDVNFSFIECRNAPLSNPPVLD